MINKISFEHWTQDLAGGVTTAIVSLPLALTFGVASGLGPQAGLYGAVMVGLFAALFGGTTRLISEPTGPMTVIMTSVVTQLIADNPENGVAMAFTVVMLAGLFLLYFDHVITVKIDLLSLILMVGSLSHRNLHDCIH